MKKIILFLVMLGVLLVGILNLGEINDKIEETLIDSASSTQQPGDQGFSSSLQVAHFIGTMWYLIIAAILLFIIMLGV